MVDSVSGMLNAKQALVVRTVAESITAARERAGLTQRDVAERLAWFQPTVSRLERGAHSPTLGTLVQVATALGCTLVVRLEPVTTPRAGG